MKEDKRSVEDIHRSTLRYQAATIVVLCVAIVLSIITLLLKLVQ